MPFTTIFFDLDDTLYPAACGLWGAIKERMNSYMAGPLGIPRADIPALREKYFREYGTTLRGLQANYPVNVADYLAYVHDLPLTDYLQPDRAQQQVLAALPTRNLIFTNADIRHARRVLSVLQIESYFSDIVDVERMAPYCKPSSAAFEIAMHAAGESDTAKCMLIDDLPRTTQAAKELGLYAVLFGASGASPAADAVLSDWRHLPALLEGKTG